MSVFGGDSWAREAQYRKRRVDDLIIEGVDESVYKRLSSGKFSCLLCPNNPILDTPLVLSAHVNGKRHQAAVSRYRDRELSIQQEIHKRIALSDCGNPDVPTNASTKQRKTATKPLIEQVRRAASEVVSGHLSRTKWKDETNSLSIASAEDYVGHAYSIGAEAKHEGGVGGAQSLDYRERLERELKFTAAGWKRDGYGRWFKDENVEFDSDEEDPNIVLNETT